LLQLICTAYCYWQHTVIVECVWESCLLQFICTAYCYWQHTAIVVCVCVWELFVAVDMHSLLLLVAYCYCCVYVCGSCLLQLMCTDYCYWQHTVIVVCVCLCGRAFCCS